MFMRRLQLPNGLHIRAEVAMSPEQLREGLMGRDSLPPGNGMLFCFPRTGKHPMWMANTRMPLDIVWIASSGMIVEIARGARPYSMRALGGNAFSSYALEIASGCAEGLRIGQWVNFD